ncbi:hypothetical protein [uncultured Tateyamaria sp.]|uniref:hypothetical protein n=1 Tax=uncultured Tateyamaria sp. TaxID=455651 RepID=UPI00262442DF|nr:hypothetical protein [uncultured Tateyamaria sp.]
MRLPVLSPLSLVFVASSAPDSSDCFDSPPLCSGVRACGGLDEVFLGQPGAAEFIFYQNDAMAFGGLQHCAAKGLNIPEDTGIAGWGD